MFRPRDAAPQIVLQVLVRSPRVCAAGTRLEKSGCQAPPRKQKARGSVDVDQGRDGQQWDCSQSLRRAAELMEGGWCTRVIPVADNHRWFLQIFSPDMKTLRHFHPI